MRPGAGKAALIGLLILASAAAAGCWDQREVERLGIVLATGIDLAPGGKVQVVVQNINPSAMGRGTTGGGGGMAAGKAGKPFVNRSAEGTTIFDAIRELSRETPRQLFFAHNQVILVSERLARERGFQEISDFLERNPEIRRTTWILVARGNLPAIMDEPGRIEDTPAQRIFGILNERDQSSQFAARRLGDFLETMESEGASPFTAVVETAVNPGAPPEHRNRMAQGLVAEPQSIIKVSGTAVFRRDKMIGWLNSKESRGLLWVRGEVRGGTIDIPNPGRKDSPITLEILRSKTKTRPDIRDGQVFMTVEINAESNLVETTGPVDLTKSETIKSMERLLAGSIRSEVEAALDKAQGEYGVDVFGFGDDIHRKYPRRWKEMKENWQDIFPGVQVEVQVEAKIRRTGMITKPLEPQRH